jgi:hypothetical protein
MWQKCGLRGRVEEDEALPPALPQSCEQDVSCQLKTHLCLHLLPWLWHPECHLHLSSLLLPPTYCPSATMSEVQDKDPMCPQEASQPS